MRMLMQCAFSCNAHAHAHAYAHASGHVHSWAPALIYVNKIGVLIVNDGCLSDLRIWLLPEIGLIIHSALLFPSPNTTREDDN
jgi:hypothetical protein